MFQKRILNAGVTASEVHRSIAISWNVFQIIGPLPKAPSNIVTYTEMGFSPVKRIVTTPAMTSAARIATALTATALTNGTAGRFVMEMSDWRLVLTLGADACSFIFALHLRL